MSSCTPTPTGSQIWEPFETSFATVDGASYAYVADNGDCKIKKCSLNRNLDSGTFGAFTGCADTGSGFSSCPTGIQLATVGSAQYGYISTNVGGIVYACPVDATTGELGSCTNATGGSFSTWPFAVSFATVGGTQYAYVASAV